MLKQQQQRWETPRSTLCEQESLVTQSHELLSGHTLMGGPDLTLKFPSTNLSGGEPFHEYCVFGDILV